LGESELGKLSAGLQRDMETMQMPPPSFWRAVMCVANAYMWKTRSASLFGDVKVLKGDRSDELAWFWVLLAHLPGTNVPFAVLKTWRAHASYGPPLPLANEWLRHEYAMARFPLQELAELLPANIVVGLGQFTCRPYISGQQPCPQPPATTAATSDDMTDVKEDDDETAAFHMAYAYVQGQTLQAMADGGRLSMDDLSTLMLQLALVLYTGEHIVGLRHGDVHTNNLLVVVLPEPRCLRYVVQGDEWFVTTRHLLVLIDYGHTGADYNGLRYGMQGIEGIERYVRPPRTEPLAYILASMWETAAEPVRRREDRQRAGGMVTDLLARIQTPAAELIPWLLTHTEYADRSNVLTREPPADTPLHPNPRQARWTSRQWFEHWMLEEEKEKVKVAVSPALEAKEKSWFATDTPLSTTEAAVWRVTEKTMHTDVPATTTTLELEGAAALATWTQTARAVRWIQQTPSLSSLSIVDRSPTTIWFDVRQSLRMLAWWPKLRRLRLHGDDRALDTLPSSLWARVVLALPRRLTHLDTNLHCTNEQVKILGGRSLQVLSVLVEDMSVDTWSLFGPQRFPALSELQLAFPPHERKTREWVTLTPTLVLSTFHDRTTLTHLRLRHTHVQPGVRGWASLTAHGQWRHWSIRDGDVWVQREQLREWCHGNPALEHVEMQAVHRVSTTEVEFLALDEALLAVLPSSLRVIQLQPATRTDVIGPPMAIEALRAFVKRCPGLTQWPRTLNAERADREWFALAARTWRRLTRLEIGGRPTALDEGLVEQFLRASPQLRHISIRMERELSMRLLIRVLAPLTQLRTVHLESTRAPWTTTDLAAFRTHCKSPALFSIRLIGRHGVVTTPTPTVTTMIVD
jgi:hypothetical protein